MTCTYSFKRFSKICILLPILFSNWSCTGQPAGTALDAVPPYNEFSLFGANFGFYPYTDQQLADLAAGNPNLGIAGVGALTVRPMLPEHFLEHWGYDIRLDAFKHYQQLGMRDVVAFIGYAAPHHRDKNYVCGSDTTELFANLYEPIWDNGLNGTPVNENNYAALYVYKIASSYGPYIKFWEVWNEPDFDLSGNGWKKPGMPGNWWDNIPQPCEYSLRAPITHYIRLLRIVYEVVKSIEPTDYVCTGGLGYPSFLDAICRLTDNPVDGSVTPAYPFRGGAWFDCLSFHVYPHIDGSMRTWNNAKGQFDYLRHSDAAAQGVVNKFEEFKAVLTYHGFNGSTYPEKEWIITEANIPRKQFHEYIGSDEAQLNFTIKSAVACLKNRIRQLHPYALSELSPYHSAQNEFQTMGLYPYFKGNDHKSEQPLPSGLAWQTASKLLALNKYEYDPEITSQLGLNDRVDGIAMKSKQAGTPHLFILWAKTYIDRVEYTEALYSLPPHLGYPAADVYLYDYARTGIKSTIPSFDIPLTGTPIFLIGNPDENADITGLDKDFVVYPNPGNDRIYVRFPLRKPDRIALKLADTHGRVWFTRSEPQKLPIGYHQWEIDTRHIPNGVYYLHLSIGDKINNKKITIFDN